MWDGNEVWLILIGGLVFAVFPPVYAMTLSGFYLLFMLALAGLIMRSGALGLYYSRVPAARRWVAAFSGGSVLAGFFLGLIAGNLIRGVPLDANGDFSGGLGSLFNPFAIVVALFALAVFANQGAAWAAAKTTGEAHALSRAMRRWTGWVLLGGFAVVTLLAALLVTEHARALAGRPLGWVMVALVRGRRRGRAGVRMAGPRSSRPSSAPAPRWWDWWVSGRWERSRRSSRRATARGSASPCRRPLLPGRRWWR